MKWFRRRRRARIESLRRTYAISFSRGLARPISYEAFAAYVRTGDAAALESAAGVPRAT